MELAQKDITDRWQYYEQLANVSHCEETEEVEEELDRETRLVAAGLEPQQAKGIIDAVKDTIKRATATIEQPIILCSTTVRSAWLTDRTR